MNKPIDRIQYNVEMYDSHGNLVVWRHTKYVCNEDTVEDIMSDIGKQIENLLSDVDADLKSYFKKLVKTRPAFKEIK